MERFGRVVGRSEARGEVEIDVLYCRRTKDIRRIVTGDLGLRVGWFVSIINNKIVKPVTSVKGIEILKSILG